MSQKTILTLVKIWSIVTEVNQLKTHFFKITIYTIYSHLQIHIVNKIKSYVITDTEPLVILNSL